MRGEVERVNYRGSGNSDGDRKIIQAEVRKGLPCAFRGYSGRN